MDILRIYQLIVRGEAYQGAISSADCELVARKCRFRFGNNVGIMVNEYGKLRGSM